MYSGEYPVASLPLSPYIKVPQGQAKSTVLLSLSELAAAVLPSASHTFRVVLVAEVRFAGGSSGRVP